MLKAFLCWCFLSWCFCGGVYLNARFGTFFREISRKFFLLLVFLFFMFWSSGFFVVVFFVWIGAEVGEVHGRRQPL